MEASGKDNYREGVPHMTKTSPYALHEYHFEQGAETAIYLHWHPEAEICWLQEGTLDFYIEDIRYPMQAGDAVFVPPNLLHTAKNSARKDGYFRAFVFSASMIAEKGDSFFYRKYVQDVWQRGWNYTLLLQKEGQQEIIDELRRIFEYTKQEQDAELFVRGEAMVIWQKLYNGYFSKVEVDHSREKLEEQLGETIRFLKEHFEEDISLEKMARTAHMSEGQFCRCFKRLTGNTPFTWLKRWRVMQSCDYLAGSDKKISEIATLCGFGNISYFNREFLRLMEVTPSAYRKRCRG